MCRSPVTGEGVTAMRQFSVGEVVTWIPDLLLRWETHGDYRIVAAMPDRDGHHMYRIKSPLEEYERVVKEDLLAKSSGYLPEEVPARVTRRMSNHAGDSATRLKGRRPNTKSSASCDFSTGKVVEQAHIHSRLDQITV
jgi:hypothetical protein